jgi:hypothetical protein
MPRKPYNPATAGPQIHDRRASDISRGHRGHIIEAEVDDPYEPGAKIATVRSVRDDPLADHFARGHIDQAQFMAGREFQKHFQLAERGPRAVQITEAVDGGQRYEPLSDAQLKAGVRLAKAYRALGADGSALTNDMLIHAMTARQIAAAQGLRGQQWSKYYARRFRECLNTLARVYGFASGDRAVTVPPPISRTRTATARARGGSAGSAGG